MGLFSKELSILAPVSGKVIPLEQVPDAVFSQKLAGDGVAIEPSGNVAVAPADGEVTMIFKTNHAYGITLDNDIELLIHIGIDTVNMKGSGFKRLVEQGSKVKAGTPIIEFNREAIKEEGFSCITPVLIVNPEKLKEMKPAHGKDVIQGQDAVIQYKTK